MDLRSSIFNLYGLDDSGIRRCSTYSLTLNKCVEKSWRLNPARKGEGRPMTMKSERRLWENRLADSLNRTNRTFVCRSCAPAFETCMYNAFVMSNYMLSVYRLATPTHHSASKYFAHMDSVLFRFNCGKSVRFERRRNRIEE